MDPGLKRTTIARIVAGFAFLFLVMGLFAGITGQMWMLSPLGWFAGGGVLLLVALYVLVDGAVSFEKSHSMMASKH